MKLFLKLFSVTSLLFIVVSALSGSGVTSAAYNLIENAGSPLTQRPTMNFIGTCTPADNSGANRTDITCSGGGSGLAIEVNGGSPNTPTTLNLAQGTGCTLSTSGTSTQTITFTCGGGGTSLHYEYYPAGVNGTQLGWSITGSFFGSNAVTLPGGSSPSTVGIGLTSLPAGSSSMLITSLPSTWDGSNVILDMDGLANNTDTGTASFAAYSSCFALGTVDILTPTWSAAGSTVSQTITGTAFATYRWHLVVPVTSCTAGQLIYVLVQRVTDTYPDQLFLVGGNVGISY